MLLSFWFDNMMLSFSEWMPLLSTEILKQHLIKMCLILFHITGFKATDVLCDILWHEKIMCCSKQEFTSDDSGTLKTTSWRPDKDFLHLTLFMRFNYVHTYRCCFIFAVRPSIFTSCLLNIFSFTILHHSSRKCFLTLQLLPLNLKKLNYRERFW